MRPTFLLWSLVYLSLWTAVQSLKICAFNIRSFGETKARNKHVMVILTKIIARCDLCLVQEVRDAKGEAIPRLVRELNRYDRSHSYSHVDSKRLGKNTYKEQYVYIYRNDMLQVRDHYQLPRYKEGTGNDTEVFSREPFIVYIYSPTTIVKDFILVGQHTCPKNAMKEIDELYDVFQEVSQKWKNQNVMFLGDLNAACSYVTAKGWRNVRLRNDPKFHWLIGDEEDTTVHKNSRCAYDRIVVHGKEFMSAVVPDSAHPFNFKKEFCLTEKEALEASDHYPVEVDLKPSHRYFLRKEL
ncbi:deoxyribonuclease gamma-like [Arapaima gigas]